MVDIWSVGCLAGTLITNTFLFAPERSVHSQEPVNDITQDPDAFNLSFLDTSREWKGASDRCKSFIRGCATLDESQRMSVAQALQHPWVAHPGFAAAMHAEYARATADWKPRANAQDLIEYVKNPEHEIKTPAPGYDARLHEEVRSHYFTSQMPILPSNIGSFDFATHNGNQSQAPLSPIDDVTCAKAAPLNARSNPAFSRDNLDLMTSTAMKRTAVEDNLSYLSIQDYAPPKSYPVPEAGGKISEEQSLWDQRLAQSIYQEERPGKPDGTVPRKRFRV